MITSPLLSAETKILHAFGTRGDRNLPSKIVTVEQVHGTEVLDVEEYVEGKEGYDILITDKPGIAIGIKSADCQPILLVEPKAGIIAAVHSGWRGTLKSAVGKAVRKIEKRGGVIENILASLGPCIGQCCCEIGPDVAVEFETCFPEWPQILKKISESQWRLNLTETNRQHLLGKGLNPAKIDTIDICTHCRPDLFHSYRRDGEKAGRMISFIQRV